jgi:hypothetical protein
MKPPQIVLILPSAHMGVSGISRAAAAGRKALFNFGNLGPPASRVPSTRAVFRVLGWKPGFA